MLLKSAAFGALLLLQFWIPVVSSAVGYQDLQYREYIDELLGRHDADNDIAPLEHTPRGLEAQRAALLAVREGTEDELEAHPSTTQGNRQPLRYEYEDPPEYSVGVQFWAPPALDIGPIIFVGYMEVPLGYTLQTLKDHVAEYFVGQDSKGNPVSIPADELSFQYPLDITDKYSTYVAVRDGHVPSHRALRKHKIFRVIWKKKWGIIKYRGKFLKYRVEPPKRGP